METSFIIFIAAFICCLFSSFAFLFIHLQKTKSDSAPNLPIFLFLIAATFGCFFAYLFNQTSDFIKPFTLSRILLPLCSVFLMSITLLFPKRSIFQNAIILFSVYGTLILFPQYQLVFDSRLPIIINTVLTGLLWLLITYSLRIFIKMPSVLFVSLSSFFIGGVILSIIGGIPLLIGLFCLCFTAPSLIFLSKNSSQQTSELSAQNTDIIGYLCGWITILISAEHSGPCAFILLSCILAEFLWAWAKRLTFLPAFTDVSQNTVCYQAVAEGLSVRDLTTYLIRTNIVLIIFSSIEIFAPNNHSLPTICALLVVWNLYRLNNWQIQGKTLKETNEEVFKEIKKNARLLKDNFTRKE